MAKTSKLNPEMLIVFVNPENGNSTPVAGFTQRRIAQLSYAALLKDNLMNKDIYRLVPVT